MAKIAISAFALGASFATYPNDIRLKFDEMQDGVQGFCNWLIVLGKRSNKKMYRPYHNVIIFFRLSYNENINGLIFEYEKLFRSKYLERKIK